MGAGNYFRHKFLRRRTTQAVVSVGAVVTLVLFSVAPGVGIANFIEALSEPAATPPARPVVTSALRFAGSTDASGLRWCRPWGPWPWLGCHGWVGYVV